MTSDRYRSELEKHGSTSQFVRGYRCAAGRLLNAEDRATEYASLCRCYDFHGASTAPDPTEFGQGVQAGLMDWSQMFSNLYTAIDRAMR